MKLYIAGAYQGQEALARAENPGALLAVDFHNTLRDCAIRGEDPVDFALRYCRTHPQAVIIANEVGRDVVPADPDERVRREAVGRALCVLAREADSVTRVVCGLGQRIK